MYIHKLYPTHMWYKHLASILAASGSLTKLAFLQNLGLRECSPNQTGDIIHGARGPGPATYKIDLMLYVAGPGPLIKHLFDDSGARQPKQSLCFRCCALRREATVQRTSQGRTTKSANDCNDWRDIFAKGAGMVYSATLKSTRKPRHLEMHLGARVQSDGTIFPGVRDH